VPLTARQIIHSARLAHPSFTADRHPNVALLDLISARNQIGCREIATALRDRLSTARKVADTIANSLVGVDANGALFTVSTGPDGYDVAVDATTGALYLGPTLIATDPYNEGFPLPADAIDIIDIYATDSSGNLVPITWAPQRNKPLLTGLGGLVAVVNGWRLIPQANPEGIATSWDIVTHVTTVYLAEPATLTSLDDEVVLPAVYALPLQWMCQAFMGLAEMARDKEFPRDVVAVWQEMAAAEWAKALSLANIDHAPLKKIRTQRNR
jgi:hypothetical protein